MKPRIIIIGAGGHGKVVCDAILSEDKYTIVGFYDATVAVGTTVIAGHKVIASQNELKKLKDLTDYFIVAIGNNEVREKLYNECKQFAKPATVIHPSAVVAMNSEIREGSVCLANSVVSVFCKIGENVIVNTGAIVDHECVIGKNVRLAVGTLVGGNSTIADNVSTVIGAIIPPFSKINFK